MQLRDKSGGTDYYDLNTTNGGITFNALQGQINLFISATNTATLTQRKYVYDLDLVSPSGDTIRLIKGKIDVDPGVTV